MIARCLSLGFGTFPERNLPRNPPCRGCEFQQFTFFRCQRDRLLDHNDGEAADPVNPAFEFIARHDR